MALTRRLLGTAVVGRTEYRVYGLELGEASRRAGVRANLALEGPRGATYFVTDYGPGYRLTSVACGGSRSQRWVPAGGPLRGLQRADLAAFLADG